MPLFERVKTKLLSSFPGLSESVFQPAMEDSYRIRQLLLAATSVPFFIHRSTKPAEELLISFIGPEQVFKKCKIEMDTDNKFKIYGHGEDRSFTKLESEDICDWLKRTFHSLPLRTCDAIPVITITIEEEVGQPPIPFKEATIADFDRTLSHRHTFEEKNRYMFWFLDNAEIYNSGKIDAETNLKQGLQCIVKDGQAPFCVATYHNNPFYVAGYLSTMFGGRKLNFLKQIGGSTKESSATAIACFSVFGESNPVLISYLDADSASYDGLSKSLMDKNRQINELRAELIQLNLIDESSEINFYDDSTGNYDGAKSLNYVNCYHVDPSSLQFTILKSSLAKDRPPMPSPADDDIPVARDFRPITGFKLDRLKARQAQSDASRQSADSSGALSRKPASLSIQLPNTARSRFFAKGITPVPGTPMTPEHLAMLEKLRRQRSGATIASAAPAPEQPTDGGAKSTC